jgi:effector-binding domain-containing protein
MHTELQLEDRPARPYVAIRSQVTMQELGPVIPQLLGRVFGWLGKEGLSPAGPPFVRFLVIDMAAQLDIEAGVPVATTVAGDGHLAAGELPAGRYATLVYTGVQNAIPANAALQDWAAAQGIAWQRWPTDRGDAWGARIESFLTGPDDNPDPATWQTEVAYLVAT